jgi:pimeloyl-ACP methyl ester carboxylesterase
MPVFSPYAKLLDELPISEHVVTVLASETHYWVYGPDDAPLTVVIAHGYRGEHHGLEPVIAQFRGVRFIGADMPGFGESGELPAGHSIDSYAHWLAEFMATTNTTDAVLIGHSFGSIISSYAVANGLITPPKLVLINPIAAPALEGPSAFLTRLTMAFYRVALRVPERVGYWQLSNWAIIRGMSVKLAVTRDKELRRFIHDQHHTYFGRFASRQSVVDSFDASVSYTVGDFAEGITMPTVLIGAEKDPITAVKHLYALADRMANSELHVIPGVGHLIHYEVPRVAAEIIRDFVGEGELADEPR